MTGHSEEIEGLLRRCQSSSALDYPVERRAAIQAILDVYRAPIFRLSFSILRDEDEAQDACQETFIRAYDHLSRYQPGTNLKAWLYRIAINVCRGRLRKRRTRETVFRMLVALHLSQRPAASPEGAVLLAGADLGDYISAH